MTRTPALAIGLAAALLLGGCNEEEPPPNAARFERPNRVAFVCVESGRPLPLAECGCTRDGRPVPVAECAERDRPPPTRTEFAFVTQSTRGELAAVDLGTRTVLDSRRDIPGFTFVPVGETPIAIVVPPEHPEFTFVANFGSRDVRILDTEKLVSPLTEDPTLAVFRIQTEAGAVAPTDMRLSPDEDGLIVAAADAGAVFWLPLTFAEGQLPLQRCAGEDPSCPAGDVQGKVTIPLAGSAARAVANPPPDVTPSQYAQRCGSAVAPAPGVDAGTAPAGGELTQGPVPELPDDAATRPPRPSGLAIDASCEPGAACTRRILVADEALPLIHAIDLDVLRDAAPADPGEAALLDPLQPGVPTRAVVATPIVPASIEGGATKYVYAIDATDGSVLVMENGRLLEVGANSTRRADRIDFSYGPDAPAPAAAAIEVVSPTYTVESPWLETETCERRNPAHDPGILNGVFLSAALTDGTVRIVDIHDMELRNADPAEAPCRACTERELPLLVRHQPRLDLRDPLTLAPEGSLQFVVEGVAFGVRDNGSSPTPLAPKLACITCDGDLAPVKPDPTTTSSGNGGAGADAGAGLDGGVGVDAGAGVPGATCSGSGAGLLCAPPDPWAGAEDRWNAVFEGTIPGTIGGAGRFVGAGDGDNKTGAPEFVLEVNPCLAGVLGQEDIAPALPDGCSGTPAGDPPSTELRGDQLVIGTRPLSAERLAEFYADELEADEVTRLVQRCGALASALASADPPRLSVEIRRAYADRLVLRNGLVSSVTLPGLVDQSLASFSELMACMPDTPIAYSIRTLGSFTVRGSQSGFLHRVHANDANRCVVDPDADPLLQGRAAFGCSFRNREVQFAFERPALDQLLEPGIELRAQAVSRAVKLSMASTVSGVVPVQLVWNPVDQQMYLVDISALGLVPIRLDPLPATPALAFN